MILSRFAYTPTETQGRLIIGDWSCFTIERPWKRGSYPGGENGVSCVPDGVYEIRPYTRPSNGDDVLMLVAPELGVYPQDIDRPKDGDQRHGRYAILIHSANYVHQVEGCIAPGKRRVHTDTGVMVTSSRETMAEILKRVGDQKTLEIRQASGAIDAPLR